MSLNRYTVGAVAVLLCFVALIVTMFRVPNVAPESVVQAVVEQVVPVAPVADPTPAPVVAPVAEVVYPTAMAYAETDKHPGSTLWAIAARECPAAKGVGNRWHEVMVLNGLAKPEDLKPGVVKLPVDCTLHGKPIAAPSSSPSNKPASPALVVKVVPAPAPTTVKVVVPAVEPTPPPAGSTHQTRGLKPVDHTTDSAADDDDFADSVTYNCSEPRPVSARSGLAADQWLTQCGSSLFRDIYAADDEPVIHTMVSDYQLKRAAELKARMDYLWNLFARNPERNIVGMGLIRLSYHGDSTHPGLKDIATLTWVDADYVLDFAENSLRSYTDSWVKEQRLQGAFFALFWRQVFSYTVQAKPADPEGKPVDALTAGS